jgi:hypothetical protein
MDEFAQQQRFFQRRERPRAGPRQDREQSLGEIARPGFHPRGVPPEPAQGQDAPVAVDQHQALAVRRGHHDARNELAILFNGPGQAGDRLRLQQPRLGEAQFETVQIDFQGCGCGGIHGANATRSTGNWL